jgi:hypothetical protein
MEWMNRGNRAPQTAQTNITNPAAPAGSHARHDKGSKGIKILSVALLFAVTAVILVVLFMLGFAPSKNEESFIKKEKMQAVFLNGGQVYFGKLQDLNNDYLRMTDIYYLRVNQQVQPNQQNTSNTQNDISLVKLGCELHGPQDEMLVNREQVIFWENLKDDGQVAKAVADYIKANPNGQQCNTTTNTNNSTDTTTEEKKQP